MRWFYLFPRVILVALIWAFLTLGFDPLLRYGIEHFATSANGATVDVGRVETQFFPPRLQISGISVTDRDHPQKNRLEWSSLNLSLSGSALLNRRLVIEDAALKGLEFDTIRATPGEVLPETMPDPDAPPSWISVAWDELQDDLEQRGRAWLQDTLAQAKSDFDPKSLETYRLAKQLETKWESRIDAYETKLKDMERRGKALEDLAKTKGNAFERLQAYQQLARDVQLLVAEAEQIRRELAVLYQQAGHDVQTLAASKQRDVNEMKARLQTYQINQQSITEHLVGRETLGQLYAIGEWARFARDQLRKLTSLKQPPRSRGVDVDFSRPDDGPGFVLRRLALSGVATKDGTPIPWIGSLHDVTSNPRLWGKPTKLRLHMQGEYPTDILAIVDRTGPQTTWSFQLSGEVPASKPATIGDSDGLGVTIAWGQTHWQADLRLVGETLAGTMSLHQPHIRLTPTGSPSPTAAVQPVSFEFDEQQILREALAAAVAPIDELKIDVELSGTLRRPDFSMESNIGPQIAAALQTHLQQEFQRQKQLAVQQLEGYVQAETQRLQSQWDDRFRKVAGDLNRHQAKAQQLVDRYTNQANSKLNDLFRR